MEIMKFGKLVALAFTLVVAAGCSSKSGDENTDGTNPNAGYDANANGSGTDGMLADEAALRASANFNTFYFAYDSSDLLPEAMRALDLHAKDLKGDGSRVVLQGNTDQRGTREYNMALGERRGMAVQRYLVLQGVSPAQLEVVSYGKERLAATGTDEESMSLNRRVNLVK
jgi:peptidoglycan-associated lipoprotein